MLPAEPSTVTGAAVLKTETSELASLAVKTIGPASPTKPSVDFHPHLGDCHISIVNYYQDKVRAEAIVFGFNLY